MRKLAIVAAMLAAASSSVVLADTFGNVPGNVTNDSPTFTLDIPVIKNAAASDGSQSSTTGGTNSNTSDQANASAEGSQAANNGGRVIDITKTVDVNVSKTVDVTKDNVAQAGQNGSAANNGGSAQSAQDNGVNAIVSTGSLGYPSLGVESRGWVGGGSTPNVQVQGGHDNQQAGANIANASGGAVAAGSDIEHSNIATGNGIVVSHGSFESLSSGNSAANSQGQTNNSTGPQAQSQGISQTALTVDGGYSVDNRAVVGATGATTVGFGSDVHSSPIQNAAGQLANNGATLDQNSHNPVTTTQIPVNVTDSLNGNALGFNGGAANTGAVSHGAGALSF